MSRARLGVSRGMTAFRSAHVWTECPHQWAAPAQVLVFTRGNSRTGHVPRRSTWGQCSMFWVGRLARNQNRYGPAIAMSAGYCWASGILVLHYGGKWGLLRADGNDYVLFTVLMLIAVLVIAALIRFAGIVPPKN